MEAIHHALDSQKENVEVNISNVQQRKMENTGKLGASSMKTPQRGLKIHVDPKSHKKGMKASATKNRRVLGDISNRNHHTPNAKGLSAKSSALDGKTKSDVHLKTPSSKKSTAAQVKTNTPALKRVPVQEVEDVELPYGGLSSPFPDPEYLSNLREDMVHEIVNSSTVSLLDDFDPLRPFGDWDNESEKKIMESGVGPSSWWSPPSDQTAEDEDDSGLSSLLDNVPPPDDFSDDATADSDSDDFLKDLISVDIDAAAK